MGHYECRNCHGYPSVDFGACDDCTPRDYAREERHLQEAINKEVNRRVRISRNFIVEKVQEEFRKPIEELFLWFQRLKKEKAVRTRGYFRWHKIRQEMEAEEGQ